MCGCIVAILSVGIYIQKDKVQELSATKLQPLLRKLLKKDAAEPKVVEPPVAVPVVEEYAAPVVVKEEAAPVVSEEPAAPIVVEEPVAPVVEEEEAAPIVVEEEVAPAVVVEEVAPVVVEEAAPVEEEAAPVAEEPVTAAEPVVEEVPIVEEAPALKEAPVVEEAHVVEEAPVVEEASVVEEAPEELPELPDDDLEAVDVESLEEFAGDIFGTEDISAAAEEAFEEAVDGQQRSRWLTRWLKMLRLQRNSSTKRLRK